MPRAVCPVPARKRLLLGALLCASGLTAMLMPMSSANAAIATSNSGDCGHRPSWITAVALPSGDQGPLSACFSKANQAEALLSIRSNRDYAQLITVSGVNVVLFQSSFMESLDAGISGMLWHRSSGTSKEVLMLGPGQSALLAIGRPPPQRTTRQVNIQQASRASVALGQLAWAFLSAARGTYVSPSIESCVITGVYSTVSLARTPISALKRMYTCVEHGNDRSHPASKRRLRRLAGPTFSLDRFNAALNLPGANDRGLSQLAFTIPGSPRGPVNPKIHLAQTNFGTVLAGQRTVEHLSASGGRPPYRYYFFNEPTMRAPPWLRLAPDGTVIIEPPPGVTTEVRVRVYVVDSTGAYSKDLPVT